MRLVGKWHPLVGGPIMTNDSQMEKESDDAAEVRRQHLRTLAKCRVIGTLFGITLGLWIPISFIWNVVSNMHRANELVLVIVLASFAVPLITGFLGYFMGLAF